MRRRDLELDVEKVARAIVYHATEDRHSGFAVVPIEFIEDLNGTLAELDKLREVERPRASAVAPPTSHEAAAWVRGKRMSVVKRILAFAERRQTPYSPTLGVTVDEFMEHTDISHQTASARFNELVNAGWLRGTDGTRKTRSGRQATVWVLTAPALDALRQARELVFSDG